MIVCILLSGCISKKNKVDENTNTKQAYNQRMQKDDIKDGNIVNDAVLLSVGDIDVKYSEAMAYILLYKGQYEGLLSNSIWSFDIEKDRSFQDASKECIINQIVTSKIIEYGAEDLGVQIEPDEKIEIEDKAINCYNEVFAHLDGKYGVTQSVVKDVLMDSYLAEKVYEVATNDVDIAVKDSEARVPVVKQIEVLFNGTDEEGNKILRTKDEALSRIKEIQGKLKDDNANFIDIAKEYSDSTKIEQKVTCHTNDKAYRKAAANLKEEELSDIVETSEGYYLLYCVSENDKDSMKTNIEEIIKTRQDDIFAERYDSWLAKHDIRVVSDLWNRVDISKV